MRHRLSAAVVAALLVSQPALANAPYATDDPEPTEPHRWEVYTFVDAQFDRGDAAGTTGLDISYGLLEDIQLTANLPLEFDDAAHVPARLGDVEVGVKWRILDDPQNGRSLAIFPRAILPTSKGNGAVSYLLPVWGQQDLGAWTVFGGGGYGINRGPGQKNAWQEGIAVTRSIGDSFELGVEVFHEGADEPGAHGNTLIDAGAKAHLAGPFSILAAAGPMIEDGSGHASVRSYFALLTEF